MLYFRNILLLTGVCSCLAIDYTVITLHTDPKSWNDAKLVCEQKGERLLNMTTYPMYRNMRALPEESPWVDIPVLGMEGAWVDLHRATTISGEQDIFGGECERMSELNVISWSGSNYIYNAWDGSGFCVSMQVIYDTAYKIDYTLDKCSQERQFYCEKQIGRCVFTQWSDMDVFSNIGINIVPLGQFDVSACKAECVSGVHNINYMTSSGLNVTRVCFAFSVRSDGSCVLYVSNNQMVVVNMLGMASGTTTFTRRCFEGAVDNTVVTLPVENFDIYPKSTCGADVSTMTPQDVIWYPGTWTWNEAFQTCQMSEGIMINNIDRLTQLGLKQFSDSKSTTTWWLGLHRPDPYHNMNVQLWSDCAVAHDVNINTPDIAFTESRLCVVIETGSLTVRYTHCNETHGFVCLTNTTGNQWTYTAGSPYSKGPGSGFGPFALDFNDCKDRCSTVRNLQRECWGFAHKNDIGVDECLLYLSGGPLLASDTTYTTEAYTFHRKLLFSCTVVSDPITSDGDIYPYSCCDVPLLCPTSNVPLFEQNIPKTKEEKFVLFSSEVSWAVANDKCQSIGGTLVQIDGVSKYHAIRYFIEQWVAAGTIATYVWTGLFVYNPSESCSGKWSGSCKSPKWISGFVNQNERGCYAVNYLGQMQLQPCNTSLPFVCEVTTGLGSCSISESPGEYCPTTEVYELSSLTTCDSECLTRLKDGLECWGTVKSTHSCTLMFSVDPMDCKRNAFSDIDFTVAYKTCYLNSTDNEVIDDQDLEPALNCVHPITQNLARCGITTSSTSTTTSTTTTSTSSSTFSTSTTANTETSSISTTTLLATDTTESSTIYTNDFMSTAAQNNSVCNCHCAYSQNVGSTENMTTEEWSQWYVLNNVVLRNTTSMFIRSKSSAYDDRPSARSIGIVATCFLGFVAVVIACADLQAFLKALQRWFEKK